MHILIPLHNDIAFAQDRAFNCRWVDDIVALVSRGNNKCPMKVAKCRPADLDITVVMDTFGESAGFDTNQVGK